MNANQYLDAQMHDYLSDDYYKWFNSSDYSHIIPERAGNYAICLWDTRCINKRVVYVGTASNLRKRLKSHPIISALRSLTEDFIVIKCKVIEHRGKRLNLEKCLIEKLKPKANKQYNDLSHVGWHEWVTRK